jgi:hypothetical protein
MWSIEYTLKITREISTDDLKGMMALRREAYYSEPEDPRYVHGGLHNLYDEAWIAKSHANDSTSHFVLVADAKSKGLVAYSRFSLVEPDSPSYDERLRTILRIAGCAVWLQVIVVSVKLRGHRVSINGRQGKISALIFDTLVGFARAQRHKIVFCDVATFPVRNEASIRYITRHGFQEIGEAEPVLRNGKTVRFTRYAVAI